MNDEARGAEQASQTSRLILDRLFRDYEGQPFDVRLWDGDVWAPQSTPRTRFQLQLKQPCALRSMLEKRSMRGLGEAFLHDDIDVDGDLVSAFALGDYLLRLDLGFFEKLGLAAKIRSLPRPATRADTQRPPAELRSRAGSRERLREAIRYHYDVPSEFWGHWLDRRRLYSCAYFESPDDDIDTAQEAKLDLVCRKLYLQPGERLFDLGCGWGALAMHAAERYGVHVTAVTLSREQASYVRERVAERGLGDRIELIESDFRDVEPRGGFHKVASVGAVEHVPPEQMTDYFGYAYRQLEPGGLFFSHGISCSATVRLPEGASFTDTYVFPDHSVMPISQMLPSAEAVGFEIRDVECLREHYALTCTRWLERLEHARAEIIGCTDLAFYKVFRLYLAAMIHCFSSGITSLHQVLLSKPERGRTNLPLTRRAWYEPAAR